MNSDEAGEEAGAQQGTVARSTQEWDRYAQLRSHLHSVTSISWSSSGSNLLSSSEDGSLKLWNFKAVRALTKEGTVAADIEPIVSYRGQQGPVLSAAIGLDLAGRGSSNCFSGSWDGSIRVWEVPPSSHDLYGSVASSKRRELACVQAHQDAVWSLCMHSTADLLFSASADATIAVWRHSAGAEEEEESGAHAHVETAQGSDDEEGGTEFLVHLDDLVFPTMSSPPLSPSAGHRALPSCIATASRAGGGAVNDLFAAYRHSVLVTFDISSCKASSLVRHLPRWP